MNMFEVKEIHPQLIDIKILAMDFDGVHTDGYVYQDQDGREMVRCSRKDGLGLNLLQKMGIKLFILSKETNPVVEARAKKLGIECYQGVGDSSQKKEILVSLIAREGVTVREVMYIGDDINDIDVLTYAGIGVTVADGHVHAKEVADIVLKNKGGEHALRELAELILVAKGISADVF